MNALTLSTRSRSPIGSVIVFEPVRVRSGPLWRAVCWGRAVLLVWGGVSLAGAAAAAFAYSQNGLPSYLQQPPAPAAPVATAVHQQTQAPSAALAVTAAPKARATAAMPAAKIEMSAPAIEPPAPRVVGSLPSAAAVPQPGRTAAPFPAAALPRLPATPTLADMYLLAPPRTEPEIAARLPRARPDVRFRTVSVDRLYEPEVIRRFRRLHELPNRYRYADPYHGMAPHRSRRATSHYYYVR
jgi:hypothetical protein